MQQRGQSSIEAALQRMAVSRCGFLSSGLHALPLPVGDSNEACHQALTQATLVAIMRELCSHSAASLVKANYPCCHVEICWVNARKGPPSTLAQEDAVNDCR